MKRTLLIICISLASAGCERSDRQEEQSTSASQPAPGASTGTPRSDTSATRVEPGMGAPSSAVQDRVNTSGRDTHEADDTGKNERDRTGDTKTSGDQSESEMDRGITQRIRQAVVADDSLSTQAKNTKIITANGVVTLRGPVASSQEKAQIATLANQVDGVKRIENQLEVAGK